MSPSRRSVIGLPAELERLQNRRVRLEGEPLEGGPPGAVARLLVSRILKNKRGEPVSALSSMRTACF